MAVTLAEANLGITDMVCNDLAQTLARKDQQRIAFHVGRMLKLQQVVIDNLQESLQGLDAQLRADRRRRPCRARRSQPVAAAGVIDVPGQR